MSKVKVIQKSFLKVTILATAMALAGCGEAGDRITHTGSGASAGVGSNFSFVGGTDNSANDGTSTEVLKISNLVLVDGQGVNIRKVTKDGAIAKVQVLNSKDEPIANAAVDFSQSEGLNLLDSSNGIVLTDDNGVATIIVKPADNLDSGTYAMSASVQYEDESATSNTYYYQLVPHETTATPPGPVNFSSFELSSTLVYNSGIRASVIIVNKSGIPVPNANVTFTGGGVVNGMNGNGNGGAVTDASGKAYIDLYPSDPTDSGTYGVSAQVVDSYGNEATSATYYYQLMPSKTGNETEPEDPTITEAVIKNFKLMSNSNPSSLGQDTVITSAGATAKVRVYKVGGEIARGVLVVFSASGGSIIFSTSNNTVITDAEGYASIGLTPANNNDTGVYTLTATSEGSEANYPFTLVPLQYTVKEIMFDNANIKPGESTKVTVQLSDDDDNKLKTAPVDVFFSTSCGTFSPESVRSDMVGKASTTYTAVDANGELCNGSQAITATTATGARNSKTISVSSIQTNSIVYNSSLSDHKIGIKGSGSVKAGRVQFTVYSNGNPVANKSVRITKSNDSPNGLTVTTQGNTDSNGIVYVQLEPGTVTGNVEILAEVLEANQIIAQTTAKDISLVSSLPSQDGLSISLSKNVLGVEGEATIIASVKNKAGNSVPDNQEVHFKFEGAAPQTCLTINGTCNVVYTAPSIFPSDSRISIVAFVDGEKSYTDNNNDKAYSPDTDLLTHNISDFFPDENENNQYDNSEDLTYVQSHGNLACDSSSFVQPSTTVNDCTKDISTIIRRQFVIGIAKYIPTIIGLPDFIKVKGNEFNHSFSMYGNNKVVPMPSGTKVSIATTDNTPDTTNGNECSVSIISGFETLPPNIDLAGGSSKISQSSPYVNYKLQLKNCSATDEFTLTVTPPTSTSTPTPTPTSYPIKLIN